jgi:hypothetical protein
METLQVYWLALQYWAGGAPWEAALEAAAWIVYPSKKEKK